MLLCFGLMLLILWTFLSLISHGLSLEACERIAAIFPKAFRASILKMQNGFFYDLPNISMPSEVFLFLYTIIVLQSMFKLPGYNQLIANILIYFTSVLNYRF